MFTHWQGILIAAQGRVEQAHQVSCNCLTVLANGILAHDFVIDFVVQF